MLVPNRHQDSGEYRYGFSGKEKDDELKGDGNSYDYLKRIYDPRIGRFFSTDLLTANYPYLTPYQFASNRPIDGNDLDGKEWAICTNSITNPDGSILVTTELVVRMKVDNQSTIITDPNIVKAKAEEIKCRIENEGTTTLTYKKDGKDYTENVKTTVVLDYNPVSADDGNIGYLIFDDRISKKSTNVATTTVGGTTTTTTTTLTNSTPGETRGQINNFKVKMGITMDGIEVPDNDMAGTGLHEIFGHSGGLNHPWEMKPIEILNSPNLNQPDPLTRVAHDIINNFLNSAEILPIEPALAPSGADLVDPGQIRSLIKNVIDKSNYDPDELKTKKNLNYE